MDLIKKHSYSCTKFSSSVLKALEKIIELTSKVSKVVSDNSTGIHKCSLSEKERRDCFHLTKLAKSFQRICRSIHPLITIL